MQAGGARRLGAISSIMGKKFRTPFQFWGPKWAQKGPPWGGKRWDFGVPTGPRMGPPLYSTPRTGDGPGVIGAHGGPVPTATIGAAAGPGQSLREKCWSTTPVCPIFRRFSGFAFLAHIDKKAPKPEKQRKIGQTGVVDQHFSRKL